MTNQLISQVLEEFDNSTPIKQYKMIEANRSLLRDLQKISYRVTQFDKKFPLETTRPDNYKEVLHAYLEFLIEARDIGMVAGEDFLLDD